MPASSGDISAAIGQSLASSSKFNTEDNLDAKLLGSAKRVLLTEIEYEQTSSHSSTVLDLKSKYIVLKPSTNLENGDLKQKENCDLKIKSVVTKLTSSDSPKAPKLTYSDSHKASASSTSSTTPQSSPVVGSSKTDAVLPSPKKILYPPDKIQLGWQSKNVPIGSGMINLGNTCYLNSTLQENVTLETLQRSFQSLEDIVKCAICLVTARPNAVQCVNNHIVCAECKADLTKCPTCETEKLTVQTLQRSFNSLEDVARCAICLVIARPTAVQCVNYHLICVECKADLTKCPTCQKAFSEEPICRPLKQMLEALPQRCRHQNCGEYLNDGDDHENNCEFREATCEKCGWKGMAHSLIKHLEQPHCRHFNCGKYLNDGDDHEKHCGFRQTKCELSECLWKGPVNELLNHVRTQHDEVIGYEVNNYDFNNNVGDPKIYPLLAFGHVIWEKWSNSPEVNCLVVSHYWILNGKPDHKLYAYLEICSNDDQEEMEFSCKVQINSDKDFTVPDCNKVGIYVPQGTLSKCVNEENYFSYNLIITKE